MKALSIRQPWAWLIVTGYKDIENREWCARFYGPLLIHASKSMSRADYEACAIFCAGLNLPENFSLPDPDSLDRGGIVGRAEALGFVSQSDSQWFCGPYGLVLRSAMPLPFRPFKGALGFFNVPEKEFQFA